MPKGRRRKQGKRVHKNDYAGKGKVARGKSKYALKQKTPALERILLHELTELEKRGFSREEAAKVLDEKLIKGEIFLLETRVQKLMELKRLSREKAIKLVEEEMKKRGIL